MDPRDCLIAKQKMQDLAAVKHMKSKAVTGKQSTAKGKGSKKNPSGTTPKKQSNKGTAKGKGSKKNPSGTTLKKQSIKGTAKGGKNPSGTTRKKHSTKGSSSKVDKKTPKGKALKAKRLLTEAGEDVKFSLGTIKKSKKSSSSKADKKAPKGKALKVKRLSTEAGEDVKYSLGTIKKSKKKGGNENGKKKNKKKPKERLPSFGCKDTVVLMMRGAHVNNDEKRVFKNDMKMMESVFKDPDYFGIAPKNIIPIPPRDLASNTTVRGYLMKRTDTIKKKLKKRKSRFIFYYTGHFSDDRSFWLEKAGTVDDDLKDSDLKKFIQKTSPEYIVFILDCCYSGKAEIGAKKRKKTFANPPIPQLWNIGETGSSRQKGSKSKYNGIKKAVQLCSSQAGQTSGYGDKYSFFTEAIHSSITRPSKDLKGIVSAGTNASVLQIFRQTKKNLEGKQNAVIKPDTASREKYFEIFPKFTKIKNHKIPTQSSSKCTTGNVVQPSADSGLGVRELEYPGTSTFWDSNPAPDVMPYPSHQMSFHTY